MHLAHASSCALILALSASAQRTWIVDDDGGAGVDFQQIQPAFEAASEGDIVLIRMGRYSAPVILDKGLRVVAEERVRLQPDRLSPLGPIPLSGRIELTITAPVHWTAGTHLLLGTLECSDE